MPDEVQVTRRPVLGASETSPADPWQRLRALLDRDLLVLGVLLAIAAVVRFAGLPARGDFDGDQGHDMLVLLRLVRDGQVPLLGPPTSIGDFHHGVAYYFLLAPAAWLSGVDPGMVIGWIAALGVAAVGAAWWFARSVGGPVAAAIAGLLLAVSPAAIAESTFIWNPNPIPLFAALALGCTWRGHVTGRGAWTVAGIAAAGMVLQLHVLGIVFLPPILALPVADAMHAARAGDGRRTASTARAIGAGLAIVALFFVPLLVSELRTGFEETRHALDFVAGGLGAGSGTGGAGGGGGLDPIERLTVTILRTIGWPLVGLITDAPLATVAAVSGAVGLGGWLVVAARGEQATVARWLGGTIAWSVLALTFIAPSLQTVVPGLPNDHYHAFLDPVVIVLVALGARALAGGMGLHVRADTAARALVAGALMGLVLVDAGRWPPFSALDGGWPAARDAGRRIVAAAPGASFEVRGLPIFKTAEGIGFPIIAAGAMAGIATDVEEAGRTPAAGRILIVACDRLFEEVIGDACGGPAEDRYLDRLGRPNPTASTWTLIERFDASPRTSVSIYGPLTCANAGAPNAGVRCPRDPDVEGIRAAGRG